jgi:hypothetical protein
MVVYSEADIYKLIFQLPDPCNFPNVEKSLIEQLKIKQGTGKEVEIKAFLAPFRTRKLRKKTNTGSLKGKGII